MNFRILNLNQNRIDKSLLTDFFIYLCSITIQTQNMTMKIRLQKVLLSYWAWGDGGYPRWWE